MQPIGSHRQLHATRLAIEGHNRIVSLIAAAIAWLLPVAAAAAPEAGPEYVIGPGDVIQMVVYGEKDLTGPYRVEAGGEISLPYTDTPVELAGCTLAVAKQRLTQHLAKILKRPRVTVVLDEERSVRTVSVAGAVLAPSVVELPVGATVFSAVARAGGFARDAGTDAVLLLRPSGEGQQLDLSQDAGGDPAQPPASPDAHVLVRSGDIVWVPRSTHRITVLGPVARPGRFSVRKDEPLTVLDAVSGVAGGPAQGTKLGSAMLVRQQGEPESINLRELLLEGDLSQNRELAPGDTLIVAEAQRVSVVGAVNAPTSFTPETTSTLVDALSRAAGLTARADLRNASIIREGDHIPIDLESVWLRGDMEKDSRLQPGDIVLVPEVDNQAMVAGEVKGPGAYEVLPNARLLSLLTAAGGPTPMADLSHATILREGKTINVNLQKMFDPGQPDIEGAMAENVPVLPGDVVFVPRGGMAYILGAVMKPGAYAVRDGSTIVDAITAAGGVAPHGSPKKILLARRDEQGEPEITRLNMNVVVAKGSTEPTLALRAGDIVYVARKKRGRDLRSIRDIFFGVAGLAVTVL
ncbi:MAG: polysaccharide biosynthesis/export family protein [Armatimonadota bacterium]